MKEEILSTENIFDGRIIHLRVHTVRLPDGNEAKREVIHHQGAVAVIAIDDAQNVLLVRQYRIGAEKTMLEIPAGLLEADEDALEAATRELREETGYRPLTLEAIGGIYPVPGTSSEYIHLYMTQSLEHAPLPQDADEFVELVRVPFRDALKMIDDGVINEAKTVVGLLRAARRLAL